MFFEDERGDQRGGLKGGNEVEAGGGERVEPGGRAMEMERPEIIGRDVWQVAEVFGHDDKTVGGEGAVQLAEEDDAFLRVADFVGGENEENTGERVVGDGKMLRGDGDGFVGRRIGGAGAEDGNLGMPGGIVEIENEPSKTREAGAQQ